MKGIKGMGREIEKERERDGMEGKRGTEGRESEWGLGDGIVYAIQITHLSPSASHTHTLITPYTCITTHTHLHKHTSYLLISTTIHAQHTHEYMHLCGLLAGCLPNVMLRVTVAAVAVCSPMTP